MNQHPIIDDEKRLQASQQYWDEAAATFDHEPDHGLRDPLILEAWTTLLKTWVPATSATILDVGCGTGSLSVILAELGHKVTGVDLSPAMLALAKAKAAAQGLHIEFEVMDAAFLHFPQQQFDMLICRHLLWALPEPKLVLERWRKLLKPMGRLTLIEGFWVTGAGLHSSELIEMLPASFSHVSLQNLSNQSTLWGQPVTDERYAILADLNNEIEAI